MVDEKADVQSLVERLARDGGSILEYDAAGHVVGCYGEQMAALNQPGLVRMLRDIQDSHPTRTFSLQPQTPSDALGDVADKPGGN
jgi:hypothetical protein